MDIPIKNISSIIRRVAVLFLVLLLNVYCFADVSPAIEPSESNQIRLGTFNIEKLGKVNDYQAKNVAKVLKNYDIVVIQEVMNTGTSRTSSIGKDGIEALKRIVSYLGDDWDCIVSPEPNGTASAKRSGAFNTFEYYAFLYRKSKIEPIPNSAHLWDEQRNPIKGLWDQERQFDREPFIASFKTKNGNLDFTLITIHAAAPAARWRRDEIKRLAMVYQAVQDSDPNQNDVFLMGDFNTDVDKKEWDSLKGLSSMKHVLSSKDITTLNKAAGSLSKSQYDTIWYQGSYSDEDVVAETAQVHQAWEEDLEKPQDISIPRKIKNSENKQIWFYGRYASDHLPVTVLLWVDKDIDHFQGNADLKNVHE